MNEPRIASTLPIRSAGIKVSLKSENHQTRVFPKLRRSTKQ
jgi:hypothetical protein